MPWKAIPKAMSTRSGNGIQFINAQGEPDVLPLGELEAVERSGRSSWREYAATPGEWPQQHVQVIGLMRCRPGSIEPGERPAEVPYQPMKIHERATLKEVQFVRLMSHMTAVNLGIILERGAHFVRAVREREKIKTGYIWGNTDHDVNEARMMWANWNQT
jgi:hypothetical protein